MTRDSERDSGPADRGRQAEAVLAEHLERAGWKVQRQPDRVHNLLVRRGKTSYAVELKAGSEGRSDRLIPLWSQAFLQAVRAAGPRHVPFAVVAAPRISPRVAEQILEFAEVHAPDAAAGVIDFTGLRRFRGPGLAVLDSGEPARRSPSPVVGGESADLFSDLNQWMLKVLLAPELPERFLTAPRVRYANASRLASAAGVGVMTAYRLVRLLEQEGYLHESEPDLSLVRREDLFDRWQASAARRTKEVPMRFLLRGNPQVELKRMLNGSRACLGLFAAADALGVGFVTGVPPYVYVKRLGSITLSAWKNLVPAEPGEVPDVILRQAPAPQSVFRGAVLADGVPVSDVLQVWLDVSAHPSRGREQADLIRRRVLEPIIRGGSDE